MGKFKDWGELLRLSMGPSAAADGAAGLLLGAGLWPSGPGPWALMAGSLAVYHGGMALNDWSDRAQDARTRPERPLPSGRIAPAHALALACALLVGGPLLVACFELQAGLALGVVALCAALYDTRARGPWVGPLLLGFCRAGNMGAGLLLGLAGDVPGSGQLALPLLYGAYVFIVSRLGRLEDAEDSLEGRRLGPRGLILLSALLLIAPALVPLLTGQVLAPWAWLGAWGIGLAGTLGLLRVALARSSWRPEDILPVMGMALRRLLLFSAAVALVAGSQAHWLGAPIGLWSSLLILAGYPLSHRLRSLFPPS